MKTNIFLYQFETEEKNEKNEKNIFITKYEEINKKLKAINFKNEIHVYDKTTIKKTKETKKIKVNNHINKTGKNPLIKQNKTKIKFYDITNIYKKSSKGVITTCLGPRYKKESKKFKNPSTYLCHVVCVLRSLGCKKVNGWLVPLAKK